MEALLPRAFVEGRECWLVFREDGADADGADELGIGEVDEDIANGPAFLAGAVNLSGADIADGFGDKGGAAREAFEHGSEFRVGYRALADCVARVLSWQLEPHERSTLGRPAGGSIGVRTTLSGGGVHVICRLAEGLLPSLWIAGGAARDQAGRASVRIGTQGQGLRTQWSGGERSSPGSKRPGWHAERILPRTKTSRGGYNRPNLTFCEATHVRDGAL